MMRWTSRELANQIFGVVSKFATALDEAKPLLLVGGTSVEDCLNAFRKGGASIIVGTPGRGEDMLNNYNVFDTRGERSWVDLGFSSSGNLRTSSKMPIHWSNMVRDSSSHADQNRGSPQPAYNFVGRVVFYPPNFDNMVEI